jgi:hypothetical protein
MKPGALSIAPSYRNALEEGVGKQLAAAGVSFVYEGVKLPFNVPERVSKYWPDFRIGNIILETKGRFDSAKERQKFVLLKAQYPDLDIRFVFSRAAGKIYKGSPTTYAQWADDHGFLWCDKGRIPAAWLEDLKKEMEICSSRSSKSATQSV